MLYFVASEMQDYLPGEILKWLLAWVITPIIFLPLRGGFEFVGLATAVAKYLSSGVRVALVAMRSADSNRWKSGGDLLRQHMRQLVFVGCGSGSRFKHVSSRPAGDRALAPIVRLAGRTLRHGPT
jgi:hypothetical protein